MEVSGVGFGFGHGLYLWGFRVYVLVLDGNETKDLRYLERLRRYSDDKKRSLLFHFFVASTCKLFVPLA